MSSSVKLVLDGRPRSFLSKNVLFAVLIIHTLLTIPFILVESVENYMDYEIDIARRRRFLL